MWWDEERERGREREKGNAMFSWFFKFSSYLVGRGGEGWGVEVEKSLARSRSNRQMYDRFMSLRNWDCLFGNCRKSIGVRGKLVSIGSINLMYMNLSIEICIYPIEKETFYKTDTWVLERFWYLLRDLDIFFKSSFLMAFLFSPCKVFCSPLVLYSSGTTKSYRLFVHLSIMY